MEKVQIINVSCNRRDLELEQIRNYYAKNGFEIISEDYKVNKAADVFIVSTCGFTQAAEDFGISTIKRVEKEKKKSATIIVGGCIPKISPDAIEGYATIDPRSYYKLDAYTGFKTKFHEIPRPNIIKHKKLQSANRNHGIIKSVKGLIINLEKKTMLKNTRLISKMSSMLKNGNQIFRIQCQEGCPCNCSYCAIKLAIGNIKSRPSIDIIKNFKTGIEKGFKKISLEGDSLGGYGVDKNTNFGELLDEIITTLVNEDIELSIQDISPKYIKCCYKQIINLINLKILNNLYIPIQSGSQRILDLMKRGYDIEKTCSIILKIKESNPKLKIGTSVIVGFPGETIDDLNKTIDVCKKLQFNYINCHCFSSRSKTEASNLPNKLCLEEIYSRSKKFEKELKGYTRKIIMGDIPLDTKAVKHSFKKSLKKCSKKIPHIS